MNKGKEGGGEAGDKGGKKADEIYSFTPHLLHKISLVTCEKCNHFLHELLALLPGLSDYSLLYMNPSGNADLPLQGDIVKMSMRKSSH